MNADDVFENVELTTAIDRKRSAVAELTGVLPAQSTTTLSIRFTKAHLHWTEHPPDAHRGFDIGSTVLLSIAPSNTSGLLWSPLGAALRSHETHSVVRSYSQNLLVTLPTPDFSMPYNVITLTGTVIALFYGSLFNSLTRDWHRILLTEGATAPTRPFSRLLAWLANTIKDD